jgi:hypothetical protein
LYGPESTQQLYRHGGQERIPSLSCGETVLRRMCLELGHKAVAGVAGSDGLTMATARDYLAASLESSSSFLGPYCYTECILWPNSVMVYVPIRAKSAKTKVDRSAPVLPCLR